MLKENIDHLKRKLLSLLKIISIKFDIDKIFDKEDKCCKEFFKYIKENNDSNSYSGFKNQKEEEEKKSKWEIPIDIMIIIGKFFKSNEDYDNVAKVCKRFRGLIDKYSFNPLKEYSIFPNILDLCIYEELDEDQYLKIIKPQKIEPQKRKRNIITVTIYGLEITSNRIPTVEKPHIKDTIGHLTLMEINEETDISEDGKITVIDGVSSIKNEVFKDLKKKN